MQKILIDSSFLFSLYCRTDSRHAQSMAFAHTYRAFFSVPDVVLPEVTFLFTREINFLAATAFLREFLKAPSALECVTAADFSRAREIMMGYPAAKLDLVDCVIMAQSERLQITRVCTYDRRDFVIFRPQHCPYLELLP